jgi:hypothetical protein
MRKSRARVGARTRKKVVVAPVTEPVVVRPVVTTPTARQLRAIEQRVAGGRRLWEAWEVAYAARVAPALRDDREQVDALAELPDVSPDDVRRQVAVVTTPAGEQFPGLGQWSRTIEQRVAGGRSLLDAANEVVAQMWKGTGDDR